MATSFETESCGRCGGGGHYSRNAAGSTLCYDCHGSGLRLTKRGKAAKALFNTLLEKRLDQVQPGDNLLTASGSMGTGPDRWHFVVSIAPSTVVFDGVANRLEITFKRKGVTSSVAGYAPDTIVRSVRDESERATSLEKALTYQATLTKTGKPAKSQPQAKA